MRSYADILQFVKLAGRINSTDTDTLLGFQINNSYENMCRKASGLGWPGLRDTNSFTTTATQDYTLPSNFDKFIENSVKYYTAGQTGDYIILEIISGSDAELWEAMATVSRPFACRVIAGSSGSQRKIRLLPNFTETGKTVDYAYYIRPATLSGTSTLEVPELAQAVAWDVLAMNKDFGRDGDRSQEMYLQRAKASFREAMGTLF